MASNFRHLANEFPVFFDRAIKAEELVRTDPRTSLIYCRMALEEAVNWMYAHDEELTLPFDTSLHNLLVQQEFKEQFNHKLYNELFIIKKVGNLATHGKPVNDLDSNTAIEALFYFSKWFAKSYAQEILPEIGLFDFESLPQETQETLSKKKIQQLQEALDKQLKRNQEQLKSQEEERQQLANENEVYRKQWEALQFKIETNKVEANQLDEVQHPRNEQETRKYIIDVMLREAGWDLQGANDKEFQVQYMPKSTNTTETGYVDYVLWDDNGLPLALVEAKKTMASATSGENQAQLYADSLEKMFGQRPVMYYSNGYETYLWDDQFYKQSRKVHGFYTKAELQTVIFRRTNRKDIRTLPIDTSIAGRFYQMRSIKSMAEHMAGNDKQSGKLIGTNRGALLVLATGTGKTRTAIAFSKVMFEANWAKRILFLADRTSLVDQAKRNYSKYLPEYTSVNLLEEKDNLEARCAFSTYNTMMGLIDGSRNDDERFYGVGHFDLIIIDEAHRSIYQKYKAIFEYFDAIFLGLTATPKNNIDKNTYHVFGLADKSPTDAYTFEEAVDNHHLVPYKTIEVPTKFYRQGIKYSELSEEEKEEFEKEILDGEEATGNEWIQSNELDEWLFNKPTARKVLQFLLKHGVKKRGGDELGKTIIFAKSKKHAHFLKEVFLELDKEQFGNDYVKIITHSEPKAKEFINRFCDEDQDRLPQIAISVDMMDTGIDAPSCVNLVFYKPVKSYTKFWQMIGRGSRLRPNLFGQGKDKTHFLIFDLCQNFEFFNENPDGIEAGSHKSLTEVVFGLRLHLAEYLKSEQFKDNKELQSYREQLVEALYQDIAKLDPQRFEVKLKLKTVHDYGKGNWELWNHLSKKDIKTIEEELAPLVKPEKGDLDLARYYDRMLYTLIKKRLETPNREEFVDRFLIPISKVATTSQKLLKKTSIPEVKSNEQIIKAPLDKEFWKIEGITHLEKLRKAVRELVKYIDPEDQRYITTNFEDEILEDEVVMGGYTGEPTETIEKVPTSPFKNNQHRLEKIIRDNEHHITITRIRNGEAITGKELEELEKLMFSNGIDKIELEKELGTSLDLVLFVKSLLGLSAEKVQAAFAKFINDYQLNSVQIEFLETIKKFLTTNGTLDLSKLYESPFKNYHTLGIDGVFNVKQADDIFKIVNNLNQAN